MFWNKIYKQLPKTYKVYFWSLLIYSSFIVILDIFSITLIPLFLGVILTGDTNKLDSRFDYINLESLITDFSLITISFFIVLVFIIKNILLYVNLLLNNQYIKKIQFYFQSTIFNNYLTEKYTFFLNKEISNVTRNIIEGIRLSNITSNILKIYKEILLMVSFIILFLINSPKETSLIIAIFFLVILLTYFAVRKKYYTLGKISLEKKSGFIKNLYESFNSIKLLSINKNYDIFKRDFDKNLKLRINAETVSKNITAASKPILEILAVGIMIILLFILFNENSKPETFISILGLYAIIIIKLSQSLNTIFILWSTLRFDKSLMEELKNQFPKISEKNINENEMNIIDVPEPKLSIDIKNLNFSYKKNVKIINNLNLKIPVNKISAIVGRSGAGKSTLLDLISGLIKPESGKILVDNQTDIFLNINSWQSKIGYIPQTTFILNSSIRNNICFGLKFDEKKFNKVVELTGLRNLVEREKEEGDSIIGDKGGTKISGGQKQILSIARAIYRDSKILILDEPTNSLDSESAKNFFKILQNFKLNKTIILITHDESLTKYCDYVFNIN